MLRRQLPAYSPLPFSAVMRGVWRVVRGDTVIRQRIAQTLRQTYGARDLLLTDSGTSALRLALEAVRRASPDLPVALPAYCCYDVATAADGAGVRVALYDIDPGTLGPDFDSLRAVLRQGVSAVVVAHLYGIPVDLREVGKVVAESGVVLIEDAAQGAGARFDGRPLGAFGSLAVLSFGRGKGITAGRGGALLAHDARGVALLESVRGRLAPARRGVRELAATATQWLFARPSLYAIPASLPWLGLGETVYRSPWEPGAISAAALSILRATLPLVADEAAGRVRNARRLLGVLERVRRLRPIRPPERSGPAYLRLPVVSDEVPVAGAEPRRLGVMPGYPRSLVELGGFGGRCEPPSPNVPGARALARTLLTLPTHGKMGSADISAIDSWLGATFG